jgi:hypothetical protein
VTLLGAISRRKVQKCIRLLVSVRIASVQWIEFSSVLPKGWKAKRRKALAMEKNINPRERDNVERLAISTPARLE